jgi:L-ascorbate metabolism protein UlaG (beta-lactamase superfamily)
MKTVGATKPAKPPFPLSDHCDGYRFFNPRVHTNRSMWEALKWRITSTRTPWPEQIAIRPTSLPATPSDETVAATWINHATVLLQSQHANILTDPVFSERTSPVQWIGPKRVHAPGVALDALPEIHVILLSHDHYDHCDAATLEHFAAQPNPPRVVTPLSNGDLLADFGFNPDHIIELDWWEEHSLSTGLSVRATPARHWSNRLTGERNGRLWSGFWLQLGARPIYYSGDTAWDDQMFADIRRRYGSPDLTLMPIGAYEPRWFMSAQHCNPAEAVRIHQTLGSKRTLGVHWGTFQLSDEGRDEPPRALAQACTEAGLPDDAFVTLAPGESLTV